MKWITPLVYASSVLTTSAFTHHAHQKTSPFIRTTSINAKTSSGGFGKKEEPKKSEKPSQSKVFEALLRDLQIEGVPLLGCDAADVSSFNAAMYTTISEMSENDTGSKACLVLEKIPMDALKAFAEDFAILKMQGRLMRFLPELERIDVSLVGKGEGPAVLIEVSDRSEAEMEEKAARILSAHGRTSEDRAISSIRHFVQRMVIDEGTCPYTKEVDLAGTGLAAKGVTPGPVGYRFGGSSDASAALASFWTCICELQQKKESDLSTIVLSLPAIAPGRDRASHDRFAAVVEIISRSLCLFRGDAIFGLVHFHPAYSRNWIDPQDKPAYGHLPPRPWLRSMLRTLDYPEADTLTDEQLDLSDYQRRSPHTAINILRANQINAVAGPNTIVDLDLGEGRTEKASGLPTYSKNAIRLGNTPQEQLDEALDAEVAMLLAQ